MSPDAVPKDALPRPARRRLLTFDHDDIIRYAVGTEVPIVGLVRGGDEYREIREMALIFGAALNMGDRKRRDPGPAEPTGSGADAA